MLEAINLEEEIIEILSQKYEVEISKDEDLELSDKTNLCLKIKNEGFEVGDVKDLVKGLDVRVVKYGNLVIFAEK